MEYFGFVTGDGSLLERIEPLWTKLNELHTSTSTHFARTFEKFSFENRKAALIKTSEQGKLLVEIAVDTQLQIDIGYCITAINSANEGEIESIYVDPEYRRLGIGIKLMKRALKWLDDLNIPEKTVVVVYGNEKIFSFYQKFGFYPRTTVLKRRSKQN